MVPVAAKEGTVVVGSADMSYGDEPKILACLKLLAGELGKTIYVISGHRTPAHSVAVGGFADDPHTEGKAADIGVGSLLRDSMLSVSENQLNAVGLYRPFYPASAAEVNHVQLTAAGAKAAGAKTFLDQANDHHPGGVGLSDITDPAKQAAGAVGGVALDTAKALVGLLFDSIGKDGARILLYLALVLGGGGLALYGVSRALGLQDSAAALALAVAK